MATRTQILLTAVAIVLSSSALSFAQDGPNIQSQGGQTLEIAPHVASQQQPPPMPQSSDNTRVIPVIPPSQQVLTLPQASRDFLGKWGGHLERTRKYGKADFPDEMVTSLTFGERDGNVVLATGILGDRDSNVLQTSADSDGPRSVTLTVQSVDISTEPPLRQVNKLSVHLTDDNQLEGTQTVDFYITGISEPLAEVEFEGKLKPLTRAEDEELADEVRRTGKVLVGKIREGNPPPDDQY
jgi:hypothetical protein